MSGRTSDLNHVEDGGGATGIVPYDASLPHHSQMPSEGSDGWGRSEGWIGQSVYEAERLVRYRPGTILLYRVSYFQTPALRGLPNPYIQRRTQMDTYHRGTVVYPEGVRRVWGAVWRRADSDWSVLTSLQPHRQTLIKGAVADRVHAGGQGMHGVGNGAFGLFAHIFPRITPYQRTVVGFPSAGSDYWTETTIAEVDKRYPGIDWTEYRHNARL